MASAATTRVALAILLLLFSVGASADRGVIVQRIPSALDRASALSVVKESFTKRGWTVTGADEEAVSGKYVGQNIEGRVRVFVDGETLRYEESATDLAASRHGSVPETRTPARWINRLRSDIGDALRLRASNTPIPAQPARASPQPGASKLTPADRMVELRKMRDAGLITTEEYERKRAEILKDL
jgi:hypothetical protein